jgi:hypothetical protein
MVDILTIAIVRISVALLARAIGKRWTKRIRDWNSSLCNTCIHAHLARGFGRRKLTRCTYAWASREMNFAVSDCTMYRDRATATRLVHITGFAARVPVATEAAARNQ